MFLLFQSATQPRLTYAQMTEDYPRYPDIHQLDLTLLNPRMIVVGGAPAPAQEPVDPSDPLLSAQDVTPYMNPGPYTVSPNSRISQVFNLFRTMGLRHLPVVNAEGEVSFPGPPAHRRALSERLELWCLARGCPAPLLPLAHLQTCL